MSGALTAQHPVDTPTARGRSYAARDRFTNQVWSWDITKLKGPVPYLYYALYVILDLFSRYVA